ncbi:MAG: alpha/beta hydrolase [Alphaproteobacteria bacterium]|nr:alpha/beta hydrolase [Alphaproteobacteria bacterium]MBU4048814.1 alpha/beta hydrolase [Alphaproteobacteria bacterium]MBU4088226.1 alpha/beta hydrolase [Alphaproteobacteria bacterium]MBU4158833.1 alpha/beta hydrolase [Alphaproteobacteria bacterium]
MLYFRQDKSANAARMTKVAASRRHLMCTDAGVVDILDIGKSQAQAIILITHGLGSVESFQEIAEGLESRFPGRRIIAYSRPGRGNSSAADSAENVDYLSFEACLALPAMMRALGVIRADLVAHSDGVAVAMLFACAHPWLVDRIVAISPQVHANEPDSGARGEALSEQECSPEIDKLGARHLDPKLAVACWSSARLALATDPDRVLGRIQKLDAPLLLIQGLKDDCGAPGQMDAISARVQGPMKWVILQHDGHYPQHDSTEVVLDLICGHLAEPRVLGRDERVVAHAAI